MKRLFYVSLCLAGCYDGGAGRASACPTVAVQSVVSGMAVAMPAMVGVQTLCAPTVQTQSATTVQTLTVPTVQMLTVPTIQVPTVQVQAFAVPTTIATPVVVQQIVRQRPVRIRTRTVTRTGFGLGLF